MDYADLAIFNIKEKEITPYEPGRDIRERHLLLPKRRGAATPRIQYKPIEDIIIRIVTAIKGDGVVDWTGLKRSTIFKALGTLEDLGFIVRKHRSIQVTRKGMEFVDSPEKRPELFTEGAQRLDMFSVFVMLLDIFKEDGLSESELADKLKEELHQNWKKGTAEINVKIMLNWVKYTKFAPLAYRLREKRAVSKKNTKQLSLI